MLLFFLSKFEICFVRPTFEGVDSLAVLLSSVRMRHPLGGTRFRVGGRLIPVFGQTDRERERERKQWQRQIRYSRSLVTQRGYQVISLSWLGNNYRAVRSCSFFMKFRGPCENIFLPFLYTQPDVEGASARCCLVGSWNKPGFFFIPLSLFFFSFLFFLYLVSSIRYCVCSFGRGIFGVSSNKQEEERLWLNFSRGRKSGRESRVIISYTGFLSFHFWKLSVHRAWDVVFVRVYTWSIVFTRAFVDRATLFLPRLSIVYIYLWLFQSLCRINDVERFLMIERMMDNRKYRLILYVLSILNIFQFIRNY